VARLENLGQTERLAHPRMPLRPAASMQIGRAP
jgi:hypothetical protein